MFDDATISQLAETEPTGVFTTQPDAVSLASKTGLAV